MRLCLTYFSNTAGNTSNGCSSNHADPQKEIAILASSGFPRFVLGQNIMVYSPDAFKSMWYRYI